MSGELEMAWTEAAMAYSKVLSQLSPVKTEEIHTEREPGWPVCELQSEPGTCRTWHKEAWES